MSPEPLYYFFDSIDRNAIVVRPKKPFFDWVNALFPEEEPVTCKEENNIYLIREMESNEKIVQWLRKNCEKIFVNELNDWYTDERKWPQTRNYLLFSAWFDVEICSMVLDLEDGPVTKESEEG